MMKHPREPKLALHAGQELGWLDRWTVGRHLAACDECRRTVAEFEALRSEAAESNSLPEVTLREQSWNRLAAEMRANIRLGVEAGQCVERHGRVRVHFAPRALVACASLAILLGVGFWLERPAAGPVEFAHSNQAVVEATAGGIQIRQGGRSLGLMHGPAADVNYLAGAQGSMRARYVDADTGQITINDVYAQ